MKLIPTLIAFFVAASAHAAQITTSGNAVDGNASISFSETYRVTVPGSIDAIQFPSVVPDAARDAVQFTGANQLLITINGTPVPSSFQDWNDGAVGSWIFFDNAPDVSVGDVITVSGTASMGTYQFGSGDSANFQIFSSGEYETRIVDNFFSIRALSTGRADLYVSDGSFEKPNLSPGESTTDLGGQWQLSEGTPSGDASIHHTLAFSADGSHHLKVEPAGSVELNSGITIQGGVSYRIDFSYGYDDTLVPMNASAECVLDAIAPNGSTTSLASRLVELPDGFEAPRFLNDSFSVTVPIDSPLIGQNFNISLSAGAASPAFFDDIKISAFYPNARVTNNANSGPGSLRQVVAEALPGSIVTFAPGLGPITLTSGEIFTDKTLAIHGNPASLTTISGNDESRILNTNAPRFSLRDLELRNGSSGIGGAFRSFNTQVQIDHCLFHNNTATCGGAMRIESITRSSIRRSTIIYNEATQDSGGIENVNSNLEISNSNISYNQANRGGGIALFGDGVAKTTLTHCSLVGNTASSDSPSIYFGVGTVTNARNSLFIVPDEATVTSLPSSFAEDIANSITTDSSFVTEIADPSSASRPVELDPIPVHRITEAGEMLKNGGSFAPGIKTYTDQVGAVRSGAPDIGSTEIPAPLSDDLLNYWSFTGNYEDSASDLPENESAANDNGSAADGVSIVTGGPLGAYGKFDSSFVEVTDSVDTIFADSDLTISLWFRVESFDTGWQALIAHGEGNDYRIARFNTNDGVAYAGGGSRDLQSDDISPVSVDDGQWHHVVATTRHQVNTSLYLDGVKVSDSTLSNIAPPAIGNMMNGRLLLGGNPGLTAPFRAWNGDMDDIAMWNRVLSEEEIRRLHFEGQRGQSLARLSGLPELYEEWAGNNIPVGADASFHGDGNGDGTANALEYVFKDVVIEMKEAGRIRVPEVIPTDVNLTLEAAGRASVFLADWPANIAFWERGGPITFPVDPETTAFEDGFVIDSFVGNGDRFYRFRVTRADPE